MIADGPLARQALLECVAMPLGLAARSRALVGRRARRIALWAALALGCATIAALAAREANLLDRLLVYFPVRTIDATPSDLGLEYKDVYFEASRRREAARLVRARPGRPFDRLRAGSVRGVVPRQRGQHRAPGVQPGADALPRRRERVPVRLPGLRSQQGEPVGTGAVPGRRGGGGAGQAEMRRGRRRT